MTANCMLNAPSLTFCIISAAEVLLKLSWGTQVLVQRQVLSYTPSTSALHASVITAQLQPAAAAC
jgi:hypothetical protein